MFKVAVGETGDWNDCLWCGGDNGGKLREFSIHKILAHWKPWAKETWITAKICPSPLRSNEELKMILWIIKHVDIFNHTVWLERELGRPGGHSEWVPAELRERNNRHFGKMHMGIRRWICETIIYAARAALWHYTNFEKDKTLRVKTLIKPLESTP